MQAVLPAEGACRSAALLDAAATAAVRSEHPLGKAILSRVKTEDCEVREPEHFGYTPGRGISARLGDATILVGNRAWMADNRIDLPPPRDLGACTEVVIAKDGRLLGTIDIADTIRPEVEVGHRCAGCDGRANGSADRRQPAGRGDCRGNRARLEERRSRIAARGQAGPAGRHGEERPDSRDGWRWCANDAPALAEASVGVAMGSGTDVAQESSDIVLLGNDLACFVETMKVARRTRAIIWQNFAGTIGIDLVGIALAAFGLWAPCWPPSSTSLQS